MKKIIITIALVCFALPLIALTGTVTEISGRVEIETDTGWKPLQVGDSIDTGKIISTGFRSNAIIQVAGSNIMVNQLTRLTLDQLTETNEAHESEIFLDLGSISADVKSAENKRVGFVVNTPVATASVRGTSFRMDLDTLSVTSGLVDYRGKSTLEMPVVKGNSTIIMPSGVVAKPVETKIATTLGQTVGTAPIPSIALIADSAITQKEDKEAKAVYFEFVIK